MSLTDMFRWDRREMKKIVSLAIPAVISNLANMGMGCVDTIVAGKASAVDMASVALGASVFFPVQLFSCGILMILGPIISNMRGRRNTSRVGFLMGNGMWLVAALSVVTVLVLLGLDHIFPLISDDEKMCTTASGYLMAMLWGVPANLAYVALRSLNEGSNTTRPAMVVGVLGLLINIPADFIFVFGYFGMPALGGTGCGVATSIVFWAQFAAMSALVYWHPKHRRYRKQLIAVRRPAFDTIKMVMRLGLPVGFSMLCEVLFFCVATLILAPLGYVAVGSLQVVGNVGGILFMIPLSIGLAASIRVAYYTGKGSCDGIDNAMRCSYLLMTVCVVFGVAVLLLFRVPIVKLYSDDPAIVASATGLFLLAALYQLPDHLQVVTIGILRGFRDTVSITVITFVAYWLIGFPICIVLSRTGWVVPAMGAKGILIGFVISLFVAGLMLVWRLAGVRKKELRRISEGS